MPTPRKSRLSRGSSSSAAKPPPSNQPKISAYFSPSPSKKPPQISAAAQKSANNKAGDGEAVKTAAASKAVAAKTAALPTDNESEEFEKPLEVVESDTAAAVDEKQKVVKVAGKDASEKPRQVRRSGRHSEVDR